MRALLLLVFSLFVFACTCETIITPFGERLSQCVIQVPSGSKVAESEGKLKITYPQAIDGVMEYYVDVPQECHDEMPRLIDYNINRKNHRAVPQDPEFPLNGWLDYGGWYPPSGQNVLNSFTSTYTIPQNPASPNGGEVLFYFIGMQDNDAPNYLNIIQPVLTWGNGLNEWYVQSWACCPSNITVSSPKLTGLKAGQQLNGVIQRYSTSTWFINSIWQGQNTSLYAQVGDFNYNWADVTLEVYRVNNCQEFAGGVATFGALALYDKQGTRLNPNWSFTPPTSCNGNIRNLNSNTVAISHSN